MEVAGTGMKKLDGTNKLAHLKQKLPGGKHHFLPL
jgi:hypothetical protein